MAGSGSTRGRLLARSSRTPAFPSSPWTVLPPRRIELPDGATIQSPTWSHDGKRIAFARDVEDGVELWIADAATGRARAIAGVRINDVLAGGHSPGRATIDTCCPCSSPRAAGRHRHAPGAGRPQRAGDRRPPQPDAHLPGPARQPHDEDLFEHFATSQLGRVDTETGEVERIGPAALDHRRQASPDEKYVLVSTVRRPFSYRVPFVYFTRKTEVWDAAGRPVATVADLPISDEIPRQGVPTGPRHVEWQPLHDARLLWTEALDGGDPRAKVPAPRQGDGPRRPVHRQPAR